MSDPTTHRIVTVAEEVDDTKRLYTIQNVEVYFTGTNRDKNQALLGSMTPRYIVLEFSPEGEYLRITTEPIP